MNKFAFFLLLFVNTSALGQEAETKTIMDEGRLLFRLEKASWFGTDDFLKRFPEKRDSIGGYLSYETAQGVNTIFYNRHDSSRILVRYKFDSIPEQIPSSIDSVDKVANRHELNLIAIRQDAMRRTYQNEGNTFKFYKNTSYNFIPLISGDRKRVLILTGPQVSGMVLIGNDYELQYKKDNSLKRVTRIHNSLLQFPFASEKGDSPMATTVHSHVVSDNISSTDVCTLLLYKNYVEWNQHIVMGKKRVSIFDLEKETLFIMKRKAWERIANHEPNRE